MGVHGRAQTRPEISPPEAAADLRYQIVILVENHHAVWPRLVGFLGRFGEDDDMQEWNVSAILPDDRNFLSFSQIAALYAMIHLQPNELNRNAPSRRVEIAASMIPTGDPLSTSVHLLILRLRRGGMRNVGVGRSEPTVFVI